MGVWESSEKLQIKSACMNMRFFVVKNGLTFDSVYDNGNCLMAVCLEEQHSSLLIIWQDGSNALCGRLLESNRAWKME